MNQRYSFDDIVLGRGWKKYVWGEIQAVHRIGEYAILEYLDGQENQLRYHPIIWTDENKEYHNNDFYWKDMSHSYLSLDAAMIGMVVYKHDGINSQAAKYFCRMISIE